MRLKMNQQNILPCTKRTKNKTKIVQWRVLYQQFEKSQTIGNKTYNSKGHSAHLTVMKKCRERLPLETTTFLIRVIDCKINVGINHRSCSFTQKEDIIKEKHEKTLYQSNYQQVEQQLTSKDSFYYYKNYGYD